MWAKTGDGAVDQAWIAHSEHLIAESETLDYPHPKIFDKHVSPLRQAVGALQIARVFQVQDDATLAEIGADVQHTGTVLARQDRMCEIAMGWLNFHHSSSELAQEKPRTRSKPKPGELKN